MFDNSVGLTGTPQSPSNFTSNFSHFTSNTIQGYWVFLDSMIEFKVIEFSKLLSFFTIQSYWVFLDWLFARKLMIFYRVGSIIAASSFAVDIFLL